MTVTIVVRLGEAAAAQLQREQVDGYNLDNGSTLTLGEWVELHLYDTAIASMLAQAGEQLRAQVQRRGQQQLEAALQGERTRLIEVLKTGVADTSARPPGE